MNGRAAILLIILGTAICGGWAYLSTPAKKPAPHATAALVSRDQIIGRWSCDQSIRVIGEPLRAHVLIGFGADGTFRQQVQVFRRNGAPAAPPISRAVGTWSLIDDNLKLLVDERTYTLLPCVMSADEIMFLADSTDIELVPDGTLRRDLSAQPLD